jgi:predicted ABC-type ATPase
MVKNLYIIAGCNGAGKTTASFTLLPEILDCKEFVNADEIAKGLSPFQPEKVSFEAGRIMLNRINELLENDENFAFETTLATKSYKSKITKAKTKNYNVTIIFFWLENIDLAIERVKTRVLEGGHNIAIEVIKKKVFEWYKKPI